MPHTHEVDTPKRKREIDDNGGQATLVERIPQPPPPQSGNGAINYLTRSHPNKLKLIHGDCDIFGDIISLISDYEGVLSRQESLAANLGAKLTGPRLVKAMEGMFEGPITIVPDHHHQHHPSTVSWLDIVQFAKTQPQNFTMHSTSDRGRVCRVVIKKTQVEITDDDWRMIRSGALERFRLAAEPLEDDENAELASLDIVEDRLDFLIKKADEVARKARQLNYHLSGRRAAIKSKRSTTGFQSVNAPSTSATANPAYDMHADLLQQFLAPQNQPQAPASRVSSVSSMPTSPLPAQNSRQPASQPNRAPRNGAPESNRDADDGPMARYRPLITARIEKLASGESIFPPCDRCRRLKSHCIKHLTACQGCTRKHAKCSWKTITEDEIAQLGEPNSAAESRAPESRRDSDEEAGNYVRPRSRDPLSEEIRQAQQNGYRQEYLPPIQTEPRRTPTRADRMDVDREEHGKEHEPVGRSRDVPLHSLLSRVASAATAAADARDVHPNGVGGKESR